MRQKDQVLGQHVARLQIRYDQDLRLPGDGRGDALDPRRLGINCVVKGQRAIQHAAGDLAALRHLAQGSGLDGGGDLGRHRLDRRQDRHAGRAQADGGEKVDGILHDVAFLAQVGKDVDRRIGDEQRLGMPRHIHHIDMADPAFGLQTGQLVGDGMHQLVGMQAALHQKLAPARPDHRHGGFRRSMAVGGIDNLAAGQIDPETRGHRADLCRRPHQDGHDQLRLTGFHRTAQGWLVAGMHHQGDGGHLGLGRSNQPVVFRRLCSLAIRVRHAPVLSVLSVLCRNVPPRRPCPQ